MATNHATRICIAFFMFLLWNRSTANEKISISGRQRAHVDREQIELNPSLTGQWFLCYRGGSVNACRRHRTLQRDVDISELHSGQTSQIGHCSLKNCMHGECSGNKCICMSGWIGRRCSKDIDECSSVQSPCSQTCINTLGSFFCQCKKGYTLQEDLHTCSPHAPHPSRDTEHVRRRGQTTTFLRTSSSRVPRLRFRVPPRLRTQRSSRAARTINRHRRVISRNRMQRNNSLSLPFLITDVETIGRDALQSINRFLARLNVLKKVVPGFGKGRNPCSRARCQHRCVLTANKRPQCICRGGYKLDRTRRRCLDENECSSERNPCQENSFCHNKIGGYSCKCNVGFILAGNSSQKVCEDVNECLTGDHVCSDQGVCINMPGYYRCECNDGYIGNGVDCRLDSNISITPPSSTRKYVALDELDHIPVFYSSENDDVHGFE